MGKITTDHTEIKTWAEKVNGKPQVMLEKGKDAEPTGLRVDFPGDGDDTYLSQDHPPKDVSWEVFFKEFDKMDLAFDFEEQPDAFDPSMSYRFIPRANIEE